MRERHVREAGWLPHGVKRKSNFIVLYSVIDYT